MLKEKSIIQLCTVALRNHCKEMLKCNSIEFGSPLENFDDLQNPITLYAIFMNDNIGYKHTYVCTLKEDDDQLLVNLTKFTKDIH